MSQPNDEAGHDVTVIGCGLMGSAIARGFAKGGFSVAAWNRTPERAEALSGAGIRPVRSVDDAVRSARLVVACTATYETTKSALEPVSDWSGTTLASVGTGTPDEVEELARWAEQRGAAYLDGSLFCFPQDIGSETAMIAFAGPVTVWAEHERTLRSLGGAVRHVSEQVRGASVLEAGIVGAFFISVMGAYVEAATYVLGQGVPLEALREHTLNVLGILSNTTEETAAAIAGGDHPTDQATLATYAEAARTTLTALRGAGQRARILAAAVENLAAAEAAGLGERAFSAQTEVVADSTDGDH